MQPSIPDVTLLEEVGRGPGSVVFRALHRGSGCNVKLPSDRPTSLLAAGSPGSFEQDMLMLARLRHAGLPRVVQLGATDETPYAIVDEARGEPLSERLHQPADEAAAIQLALAVGNCLSQLHAAGFVHGSITPQHVRVCEDSGRVSLVDEGSVSRPVPFDARADVQAFGALLRDWLRPAEGAADTSSTLSRMVDDLASGRSADLQQWLTELALHADDSQQRRSSFPPPSCETPQTRSAPDTSVARRELAQLQRAWSRVREHGGKVVEVLGAAGSGKSRVLGAFAQQVAGQGVQVLSVRCRDSDWAPFSTLKRLLEGHLTGLKQLDAERRAQLATSLRVAAGPMAARIRLLSPLLGELFHDATGSIADGDVQQVFVASLAEFLAKYLEASGPTVLVLDDIHWLDASSRMVLSRVAARLCPQGHLIVCAARDDADSREPLTRFRAALPPQLIETISLGPLAEHDAAHVIGEYLGLEYAPNTELVEQLTQLSDGTPLCLIELLQLVLERGYLKPHDGSWQLDARKVHRMRLPASSRALIERRLARLPDTTLDVLRAAAVIRSRIEPNLLAQVTGLVVDCVQTALEAARSARLLESDGPGGYRFVHDCVWEGLLRPLARARQRELHERVAEALYMGGASGAEAEYELARHHAAGMLEKNPRRAYEATRRAGRRAFEACDDALALSLLKAARDAAQLAHIDPDRDLYMKLAETSWRAGASRQSLAYFERVLQRTPPGFERAHVLGRIAWIHHYDANVQACMEALKAALAECGRSVPEDRSLSLAADALRWAAGAFGQRQEQRLRRQDAETLCGLYVDCMRVALESGHPTAAIAATLQLVTTARQLEPCRVAVHAELLLAFLLANLGMESLWRARYARAETMARELGDPIAQTLCHQLLHVISGWLGDLEECERQARICVDERGHFMELAELCHVCFAMYGIEIARGRPEMALCWTERVIERVRLNGCAPAAFALIEEAASSTLLSLGRDKQIASLKRRLRFVQRAELQRDGYFHLLSFQSRVQQFTERGNLGEEFEALVEEFQRQKQHPKQMHILVAIYYVHVAHARVHQCLRADAQTRQGLVPKLARALRDLEAAERMPAMGTHARFIRGALRWFQGEHQEATQLLAEAEGLAQDFGCVWVSFAVARLRAHMLRSQGNERAARDMALVATVWAKEYVQVSRLRVICEEFGLPHAPATTVACERERNTRRHLDALLHISQANSRELGPERQARLILDELIETVDAEHAFLFMRDAGTGTLELRAARRIGCEDLEPATEYDPALVEQVYATGQTELTETSVPAGKGRTLDRACLVAALVFREQAVGVLYLDRSDLRGGFSNADATLLQALANQVPVALELGSSLRERDRLQDNLRQAHKMEAIGRLAGGIAHDFNNILAAIQIAAGGLALSASEDQRSDLDDILASSQRGAELTRQLLMFSRGEEILPRAILLADVVQKLTPMLRRLVATNVQLDVEFASDDNALPMLADPSQIERVLMNLCQNASDAMPKGGRIAIRVEQAALTEDDSLSSELGNDTEYALLTVSDTGHGMTEEVRSRLFEPFFTTKSAQHGTGLGLANVYAIVQHCGGHIEVLSEPGSGSTFRVYLPLSQGALSSRVEHISSPPASLAPTSGERTVLVVDDDDTPRRAMIRVLRRAGYAVLAARNGEEALHVVDSHHGPLQLAVTDVHMPGMDGSQLAASLLQRDPTLKLLFVSGEGPLELQRKGLLDRDAAFLHKPFEPQALIALVQSMLGATQPDAANPTIQN